MPMPAGLSAIYSQSILRCDRTSTLGTPAPATRMHWSMTAIGFLPVRCRVSTQSHAGGQGCPGVHPSASDPQFSRRGRDTALPSGALPASVAASTATAPSGAAASGDMPPSGFRSRANTSSYWMGGQSPPHAAAPNKPIHRVAPARQVQRSPRPDRDTFASDADRRASLNGPRPRIVAIRLVVATGVPTAWTRRRRRIAGLRSLADELTRRGWRWKVVTGRDDRCTAPLTEGGGAGHVLFGMVGLAGRANQPIRRAFVGQVRGAGSDKGDRRRVRERRPTANGQTLAGVRDASFAVGCPVGRFGGRATTARQQDQRHHQA